jgi:hypothetical protein
MSLTRFEEDKLASDAYHAWMKNGICPVCGGASSVYDIDDSQNTHHKCMFPKTNADIRVSLNNETNIHDILDWIILEPKLRNFYFRDAWHKIHLTWTFPPKYDQLIELSRITGFNGYLEIGAGTGLFAALMMKIGFDFVAVTDPNPGIFSNIMHEPYCEMKALNFREALIKYGSTANTLFTCWPLSHSYNEDVEKYFKGNYIVHIGEKDGGCTYFGEINLDKWTLIYTIKTPRWCYINDRLEIYERNQ